MNIELFQDCVWAIHPAKLDEITAFVRTRAAGGTAEVKVGKSGLRAEETYRNNDGVAVIPVYGILAKRANLITDYSGGTSYQLLWRDVEAAGRDPSVKAILLDIDSPGGTTDGIVETVDAIASVGRAKPVVAYGQGMMTSAAQWIASAAGKRVIGPTTLAGSIGVAMVHYDASKHDEQAGVKRTEIFSGKYKRMGSDAEPLSSEARAYLQERCDYLYGLFVEGVARNMGLSVEQTLKMADGRIYTGQQAVDVGLADRVGTMDLALELARGECKNAGNDKKKGVAMNSTMGGPSTGQPGSFEEVVNAYKAQGNTTIQSLRMAVAKYPELHQEYIERRNRERAGGGLQAASPPNGVFVKPAVGIPIAGQPGSFEDALAAYKAQGNTTTQALRLAAKNYPELHREYIERTNREYRNKRNVWR